MELENKFINLIPVGHHLKDKFQTTGSLAWSFYVTFSIQKDEHS